MKPWHWVALAATAAAVVLIHRAAPAHAEPVPEGYTRMLDGTLIPLASPLPPYGSPGTGPGPIAGGVISPPVYAGREASLTYDLWPEMGWEL